MASEHLIVELRRMIEEIEQSRPSNAKLPSERQLAEVFGTSRTTLRTALAEMENQGLVWRGVGKGTFVGPKPAAIPDIEELSLSSNPVHVMRARLAIEPELAGLAASNATLPEIKKIKELCMACESAASWTEYERADTRFHRAIAESSHNPVLIAMNGVLHGLRRFVNRGRIRLEGGPSPNHHSFEDHRRIVDSIASQNSKVAMEAMKSHLHTVEDRLLGRR